MAEPTDKEFNPSILATLVGLTTVFTYIFGSSSNISLFLYTYSVLLMIFVFINRYSKFLIVAEGIASIIAHICLYLIPSFLISISFGLTLVIFHDGQLNDIQFYYENLEIIILFSTFCFFIIYIAIRNTYREMKKENMTFESLNKKENEAILGMFFFLFKKIDFKNERMEYIERLERKPGKTQIEKEEVENYYKKYHKGIEKYLFSKACFISSFIVAVSLSGLLLFSNITFIEVESLPILLWAIFSSLFIFSYDITLRIKNNSYIKDELEHTFGYKYFLYSFALSLLIPFGLTLQGIVSVIVIIIIESKLSRYIFFIEREKKEQYIGEEKESYEEEPKIRYLFEEKPENLSFIIFSHIYLPFSKIFGYLLSLIDKIYIFYHSR